MQASCMGASKNAMRLARNKIHRLLPCAAPKSLASASDPRCLGFPGAVRIGLVTILVIVAERRAHGGGNGFHARRIARGARIPDFGDGDAHSRRFEPENG